MTMDVKDFLKTNRDDIEACFDKIDTLETCLENIEACKKRIEEWESLAATQQAELNELTNRILDRESDTETPAWLVSVSDHLREIAEYRKRNDVGTRVISF